MRRALLLAVIAFGLPGDSTAQSWRNVLVIANRDSAASEAITDHYIRARAIPGDQVLRLSLPLQEEIGRDVYQARIEEPVKAWLTARGAQDRILYFVLTKDVPLRIAGTGGERGTVASVDSELTLVYQRLWGRVSPATGPVANPYFAGGPSGVSKATPFTHRTHDLYLVTRLDGYTVDDVKALIDRGLSPERTGTIVLDGRLELTQSVGNRWLNAAAEEIRRLNGWSERVEFDASGVVLQERQNVFGYYSWGSNDRTTGTRTPGLTFVPGALAAEYVSTDARTFQEPPSGWTVNGAPFRGSHQSLIGDFIRHGVTGVAGHVAEPYLNATIRPDILFPAYLSGYNLAESFYMAMPSLSWQTVVIGDPLCAPFKTAAAAPADLDPPLDPITELPQFLSTRRVRALAAVGVKGDAAAWMAKAEILLAREDSAGAREALERATAADPAFTTGHMVLANLFERMGEWDLAISRYRQIIAANPNDGIALNNLAYGLATRMKQPAEALPFARRAYAAVKDNAATTDTLAWIYHLLDQDLDAEPLIVSAMRLAPNEPEIHLHAAVILAARGKTDAARTALDRALKLNPAFADHAEAVALRERLQ